MKRLTSFLMALCVIAFGGTITYANPANDYTIALSNSAITVNGEVISSDTGENVYKTKVTETHSGVSENLKNVENTVINITSAGTYRITGSIDDGQIYVNAADNDSVTLLLDNATINCRTAPTILIKNAYDPHKAGSAGVTIKLADNSTNNISGSYNEENDAAVSSDVSVTIEGNGTLNVTSDNEGIETKQHLTINSGNLIINSADDAINGSEDGVSHITINGGFVFASASLGVEGDGIDSNGYITINGGTVVALAHPTSQDGGVDADLGVIVNGGTVVGMGNMQSELSNNSAQQYIQLIFATKQAKDTIVTITDASGSVIAAYKAPQAFTAIAFSTPDLKNGTYYAYVNGNVIGTANNGLYTNVTSFQNGVQQQHSGSFTGMSGGMGTPPEGMTRPEGMGTPPEGMTRPEGMGIPPEGMTRPEGMGTPPEGMTRPEGMGTPPEGMTRPEGMGTLSEGMERPDEMTELSGNESAASSVEFTISSTTRTFSGVKDATASEVSQNNAADNKTANTTQNNTDIKVMLKNEYLSFDVAPIIENGRTLVPLRAVFEALGMEVEYNNGEIIAAKEGLIIQTAVGSNTVYKNGEVIILDVGSKIVNGRTLVPVRFIAESAGLSVEYDESIKIVIIK